MIVKPAHEVRRTAVSAAPKGHKCPARSPNKLLAAGAPLGIHYRGVQWEGGAVDGGSTI